MSKVVIDDSKLVNIADAIRNKNGSANKYTPTEMATAIGEIKASSGAELAPEDLVISGDCRYKFYTGKWDWFIKKFGDKITTEDITYCNDMFNGCKLSSIPFDINIKDKAKISFSNIFFQSKLTTVPYIKALNNYTPTSFQYMFRDCVNLIEIPEDYFDKIDFSTMNNASSGYSMSNMFYGCYRLRRILADLSKFYTLSNNYEYQLYTSFGQCNVLDELTNLPVTPETATITNNLFQSTFFYCYRLKRITFSLNNGMPKIARWQNQTIAADSIGFGSAYTMPSDTRITDDASYQLLKDNEDSWTTSSAYSRYNHDSAVETINTLPDTSAYLAESGGTTNIIKFTGASGSATDGGAINTLTEAEIAVAAAKGWSVSFV